MSALPIISVVVPSFNQGQYIDATLRSILEQKYPRLELIVIDGGSTDSSVSVIRKYAEKLAYWVSEPDGGQTYGLVKGFQKSTGDIQCWINSDDMMANNCLIDVADFFLKHPTAMAVYGNATWIDRSGKIIREQREIWFNKFIWFNTYNYIPGMSMYWRRSLYEAVGGLDPTFNLAMDTDLFARFADVASIFHVNKNWSFMRLYPEQKNRSLRARSDFEDSIIRTRHIGVEPRLVRFAKRRAALALRIFLKLVSGCYGLGYRRFLSD